MPGITITPSRDGKLEIRFAAKPGAEIRAELKLAGYRWHGAEGIWYGPSERLPARYRRDPDPEPALEPAGAAR